MEEILSKLGLSDNEITLYLLLLKTPKMSAQELATTSGIKRTNVYRVLDVLTEQELIVYDEAPIKRFSAAEPQALQRLLQRKQSDIKQTAASLSTVISEFRSQYALSTDKPGVVHMAGDSGFERLLEDMVTSTTEVLLVASDDVPQNEETLKRFRELLIERKDRGVKTRALFHDCEYAHNIKKEFDERGIETRFIGTTPFKGEVALYEENTVFTVYDPSLVVTILTNKHIAATMRLLFEELWQRAK